ncbi:MAG: amidohydrolase family protein [Tetrasphaera sp.]
MNASIIDVHTHVFDPDLPDFGRPDVPVVRHRGPTQIEVWYADRFYRHLDERSWAVTARLADMDAEGVGVQVLSPTPITLCHNTEPATAVRLAAHQNEFLAGLVAASPDRFLAFGHIPLQSPSEAVRELDRCLNDLGFAGVEIGTQVGDLALSDETLTPFWEAAHRHAATVFIHPLDHCVDPRIVSSGAGFGLGMPTETARAAADLLLAGTLDRYPDARVLLAHGGGSLPAVLPRLAFGQTILSPREPGVASVLDTARRLWSDSLTYDAESLMLCASRFGPEHLVVGTDYPFSAREQPAGAVLDGSRFTTPVADGIRHGNALALLGRSRSSALSHKEIR